MRRAFVLATVLLSSSVLAVEATGPTVKLLEGTAAEASAFELPRATDKLVDSFTLKFDVTMTADEGLGLLLMDAVQYPLGLDAPALAEPEEPNLRGAIGIGFDTKDLPPAEGKRPTTNASNIYDRPQREVSLHVDGIERFNRASLADFATGQSVPVELSLKFVPGGAELSLTIDGKPIYHDELLAGVRAFVPRAVVAARGNGGTCSLTNVEFTPGKPLAQPLPEPSHVVVFDNTVVGAGQREPVSVVDFTGIPAQTGRVIATIRLDTPPGGIDPWDRRGALYLTTLDKHRYEIARFMTPYDHPFEQQVDVTDFLPLFQGQQTLSLFIDTWQKGFAGTVTLEFYPGKPKRTPIGVVNLWQGEPILGDPKLPVADFFDTKTVLVPQQVKSAKLRLMVTGHGQAPNSQNAAEFIALKRTLAVNGTKYENVLWKEDNYLNPCRPQKGTWAFDRAGWAPGSIVQPWEIDVTDVLKSTRELTLDYAIDPYENASRGQTDPPTQWVDSQVILYAD
ncbi:MAG: peptide-N-glycosidase F-related protein [Tepidisphaeraceae bacterium]